jgi:hypothetical protein
MTITLAPASVAERIAVARSLSLAVSELLPPAEGYPGIREVCATAPVTSARVRDQITNVNPASNVRVIGYFSSSPFVTQVIEARWRVQIFNPRSLNILSSRVPRTML